MVHLFDPPRPLARDEGALLEICERKAAMWMRLHLQHHDPLPDSPD
jgi:hypothetical protein